MRICQVAPQAHDRRLRDDVYNAMRALGVSDSADVENLRISGTQYQRAMRARRDSLTGRNIDPRTAAEGRAGRHHQEARERADLRPEQVFRAATNDHSQANPAWPKSTRTIGSDPATNSC